ncbi:LysR family transcriptional regulator [Wenxinia saemankumensis]|uniref:Transcriptional regulator, LysR family n=1 Tax=Wenxinia saemankumensis TaxID=1447782 RepID=A0A1M6B1G1_9RHOB|nr:LysR family transcriptional regulator [Wenxinia saemankumensis]SHI42572.1 transcriptional regulator, LysR family [Wenxinia saemankumensis]
MPDLRSIRVFLQVAEGRSFAGAARALAMTPASVTRIVARLEEDLGQQLLVRTSRRVAPTAAGARVAARYAPILAEFDAASAELERALRPDRGTLSISVPMSFGQQTMPGLIAAFRLAFPNVRLRVNLADRLIDILGEGVDLAIRISAPPTDRSTIWRRICAIPRHVVAAPSLFDRAPRPGAPGDLDPALCLSYGADGTAERWSFAREGGTVAVTAGSGIVCNNGDVLLALAASGAGMTLLPDFLTEGARRDGTVETVLPDWESAPLSLGIFYPPYDELPPLVATFTDFFEAYLRDRAGFAF